MLEEWRPMTLARMIGLGACAIALSVAVPSAHGSSSRAVSHEYVGGSGSAGVVSAYPVVDGQAPLEIVTRPHAGERSVTLQVQDSATPAVAFVVSQSPRGGGEREVLASGCGATAKPVRLVSTEPVQIRLLAGSACGSISVPTQGSAKLVFRR